MEKLLLHICCGPCLIYPLEKMIENFDVKGYFFNPNIYPDEEKIKRKENLQKTADYYNLDVKYELGEYADYLKKIKGKEKNIENERCKACYELRLLKTAEKAKEEKIKYFSTSLLVSPYQDIGAIREIGEKIASQMGLTFYFKDFREGFYVGRNKAKALNIYRQNYCGCSFSLK